MSGGQVRAPAGAYANCSLHARRYAAGSFRVRPSARARLGDTEGAAVVTRDAPFGRAGECPPPQPTTAGRQHDATVTARRILTRGHTSAVLVSVLTPGTVEPSRADRDRGQADRRLSPVSRAEPDCRRAGVTSALA